MGRMSREFSLVLLGAGMLTAGSFTVPEKDLQMLANQQAAQQVAGAAGPRPGGHFHFIHIGSWSGASGAPARPSVSRGGFGSLGRSFSGGVS